MDVVARPGYDPELKAGLAIVGGMFPPSITADLLDFMRISYASGPVDGLFAQRGIAREDHTLAGHAGDPIEVSVLRPDNAVGERPAVLFIHSGGLMFGDRFSGIELALDWITEFGWAVVAVEYRLAPEHVDPYPREDVYAALEWMAANAESLGLRADRLAVSGGSCGGGMAAGVALAARDRAGPRLAAQVLDYPMLDDRGTTASMHQFDAMGVWDRISNETGWAALLGERCGGPDVSPYTAPARATDLSGLPPAYIDVGSAEIFRDEAIAYAQEIWRVGGNAELHVWAGAFHACDVFAPHTSVGREMIRARNTWLAKILDD